jgi:dipeptidyl-peptidase 4
MKRTTLIIFSLIAGFGNAQGFPKSEIPLERLFQYPLLQGRSPSTPQMSPDGGKIVFGWNQTGIRKLDLYVMEYPSGKVKKIVDATSIKEMPRQDDLRKDDDKKESELYDGGIGSAQWAPDGKELLFGYKGRNWLVNPDGTGLHPVVDGSSAMFGLRFTEDGKYLAYTNGTNVFRMERDSGRIKQLTFISKPGTSIDDFSFSADGKYVAVQWSDSSKVGSHQMMDFSKDRATVVPIQRTWNGELSTDNQIGIVPTDGGLIKFVKDIPHYCWVKSVEWSPDGSKLAVGWIKDDFMEFTISMVDPAKAEKKDILVEKAPSNYINDWRDIVWARDSKSLYFGTDIQNGKFINRSIFQMKPDGTDVKPFYAKGHDVGAFGRPKKSDRMILVTAARSPLTTEIEIVEPDGKEKKHVVMKNGYASPKDFNSALMPLYSDDGKRIATMASSRFQNPELYGVEPEIKRLTTSQLPDFAKVTQADIQEVSFKTADGREIHGLLFTKPGMDTSKPHPAILSNIYADSGKAAWGGYVEHYAATQLDMVVLAVDFRSSWGYDGEFNSGYYRKMGLVDVDEAVAAKNFLASLPYVRGDRVGLWGWSYGGYLTCMTLLTKPGVFHTGVAVASVTDWKSYNEWYTRRRLGLVTTDKEWFEKTSPITYASGLKDNLLLVHGMLDDNVLFQDTARLMQRMIDSGVYFDTMAYPRDDHSIGKDTSRPHVFATVLRYLYQKLNQP